MASPKVALPKDDQDPVTKDQDQAPKEVPVEAPVVDRVKKLTIGNGTPQVLNILVSIDGKQQTVSLLPKASRVIKYVEFSSPQLLTLVASRHATVRHG